MATAERELINRPFIQPSVTVFDERIKDRQTPRSLIFMGDRISRRRKQEVEWLQVGGIEESTPCIQKYVIQGYVPRGYATPVEPGMIVMPQEHMRNVGGKPFTAITVEGARIEGNRSLAYTIIEPGDAVANIIRRAHNDQNMRNGLTELRSLYGYGWDDYHKPNGKGVMDRVEALCFGDGQTITLRELRAQIAEGLKLAASENLRFDDGKLLDLDRYGLECEQSANEFFDWGMAKLDEENTNLRTGAHPSGLVYRYSPLGELLLTQLEVVRQDRSQIEQWRQQFGKMNESRGEQPPAYAFQDVIELGRKLERAEARILELEAAKQSEPEKPLHWKQREKLEREAKLAEQPE